MRTGRTGRTGRSAGFKMAEFGVQTSSVDLVAHWESSHWSTTLDASSLTPGQVVHGRLPGAVPSLRVARAVSVRVRTEDE